MTNPEKTPELCANCPNRNRISQLLARVAGQERPVDCEGPVTVQHGIITTQIRKGDEPSPPQKTWNAMSGNYEERQYHQTHWTNQIVCGREPIEPAAGEVLYDPFHEPIYTNKKGRRFAAFLSGSEEAISMTHFSLAMMSEPESYEA